MSYADQAARTETAHPVQTVVNRASGGATGLTVVVAIRLGSTVTTPSYLDFADAIFKTIGHTTRQRILTEVSATNSPGIYALAGGLDINGMVGLPADERHLVVEFEITAGGARGEAVDAIVLKDDVDNDLSNLDVAVSTRSDFNEAVNQVTVATNNDKTGYSIAGTKTTLDALNDFDPATQNVTVGDVIAAVLNKISDDVLSRPISNVEATAAFRSLSGAIAKLVNKVDLAGSTLTIRKTDDAAVFGTQTVTTDAAADPIVAVDTN